MAQLFSPSANVYSRVMIVGIVILVCGAGWATSTIYWSPYTTKSMFRCNNRSHSATNIM